MIKMTLDPQIARQFIKIIGAVVDKFRLQISKDGWKVVAVDPAKVAMVFIVLPKDSFQSYEFGSDNWSSIIDGHPTGVLEEQIVVGVDVEEIKKFFGGMKKTEIVLDEEMHALVEFTFSLAPDKCGRYQIRLKQGMFSRTMLLLPEKEIRKSPENITFKLDYKLQIGTLDFRRIIEKAAEISDYINLGFRREEESSVIFTATTVDGDEFPWDAAKRISNWEALSDKARTNSRSLFSLDYLLDITETLPDKVWLHIGQDNPCTLSFGLGQTGSVEYWLAPRIESE